jgi:SRSO17 transposase
MTTSTLEGLTDLFPLFHARRAEVRARSARYLQALLSPVARKNGWQLAEAMGERDSTGAQRLLYEARWDADAVRDDLVRFVLEVFGAPPEAVLVVDETGFLKKGTHSVGVARQYTTGTAGKVENCQIGVFLAYATPRGTAFLNRRLYLPEGWAADQARREVAKVPAEVAFQTKPALAQAMLAHAFALGVVAGWVVGDCVYGSDPTLRLWLGRRRQPFVLGVRSNEPLWVIAGDQRRPVLAAEAAAQVDAGAWQGMRAADGSSGGRAFVWASSSTHTHLPHLSEAVGLASAPIVVQHYAVNVDGFHLFSCQRSQ